VEGDTIPGRQLPLEKGAQNMGQRVVRFSDLTNNIIENDDDIVRVVIEQHPALTDGPVEIEVSHDEIEPIRKGALSVVSLKLYKGDGSAPEALTMEIEAFNQLAGEMDMADVIRRAEPAYPPRRQTKAASLPAAEKLDYATLEHAGKPHRGKTTDAEKEIVRMHLDEVNERLARDGMRTISLDDPEMVARYGLETLANDSSRS
jgi:hypothetical protein